MIIQIIIQGPLFPEICFLKFVSWAKKYQSPVVSDKKPALVGLFSIIYLGM